MDNSKKKLLFASRDLCVGGMEKALVTLLSAIDHQRFDVTLVLERADGALLSQLDPCVKVVEYKVSALGFAPLRKAINLLRRTVFKIRHGGKYDFSCCYATYSTPCEKAAKIASGNCMLYVHSDYVGMYGGDVSRAKEFYDSIGIDGYRRVAFVSEGAREGASLMYPELKERFLTLGNLSDCQAVVKMAQETADVPSAEGKTVLVFAGRLDDTSKKLGRLIDAVDEASRQIPQLELWIIGNGPDGETYKSYADRPEMKATVRFLGEKTNPYPYLKRADALVLTSDYEGFPVVYWEAAALSRSVITTAPASDGFFKVDGSNAYVAEKSSEGVASAIREFVFSPSKKTASCDHFETNSKKLDKLYSIIMGA